MPPKKQKNMIRIKPDVKVIFKSNPALWWRREERIRGGQRQGQGQGKGPLGSGTGEQGIPSRTLQSPEWKLFYSSGKSEQVLVLYCYVQEVLSICIMWVNYDNWTRLLGHTIPWQWQLVLYGRVRKPDPCIVSGSGFGFFYKRIPNFDLRFPFEKNII